MIEVNNINFLNGNAPTDLLRRPMRPVVQVVSTKSNQALHIKITYVATTVTDIYDQVLCEETVEEIPEGVVEFDLECKVPDLSLVPREYLLGLTSIILVFSTPERKEFARIGYFVKVDYPGVQIREEEPAPEADAFESASEDLLEGAYVSGEDANEAQQEEAEEGEAELQLEDGVVYCTPEEFAAMSIDIAKIEAELLEPPLVTLFGEAWACTELESNGATAAAVGEPPE